MISKVQEIWEVIVRKVTKIWKYLGSALYNWDSEIYTIRDDIFRMTSEGGVFFRKAAKVLRQFISEIGSMLREILNMVRSGWR